MDTRTWLGDTGGPVDDAFRLVREQVPGLVTERPDGIDGGDNSLFFVRVEGSVEAVEVECWPGGRPPFTVSDEYSQLDAADPAAAAAAILEFLRA
ncbi:MULTISPECIES: hypothetical protein [unclassified Kitasatospora]|uniref:hypothetical protein n=1 Tax=unclassified Kitasatospora TaxID=2633591 RepID=UPI00071455E1|nr:MULTISPECIES: hypothetical protein [unclassified Kitasatospora]KQV19269.1 hypothetical protein ASC99_24300 [Kitasatospora sp. Root107]